MRWTLLFFLILVLGSCNMVKWNQSRMTKKYVRHGIEERIYSNEGHTIHYFEGGEGETVLLIHGFGGDAQVTWNKTIQDLTKDHHVIVPDLLWFGKSHSTAKAELSSQVDALIGLLKDRKVDKCDVVGISYGGFVTFGLVYQYPEFFRKMIIVDSPGITYDIKLLDELAQKQNEKSFQDIFVVKNAQDVDELFTLATYRDKKIPKGFLEDAYEVYFDQYHAELDQLLTTLTEEQSNFKQDESVIFPRSLVIWGQYDEIFPPAEGKKFAEYLKADYKEVPNAGHAPNIENYKVFEAYLREFLAN
ncbi:MAG: alpha/beta hydrolase [Crocinitomicaceae bacterium]|nr:alpha/beta hydrolase [Crocinitomicaceae bacterium]